MDVYEVIQTMHEKTGLSFDSIASLSNVELWRLDASARDESELLLDELQRILDVGGYKVIVRDGTETLTIRADRRSCTRYSDVMASKAMERLFEITGKTFSEVSEITGFYAGYFRQAIRKSSIPKVSVFVATANAVGFEVIARQFGESYSIDSGVDSAPDDYQPYNMVIGKQKTPARKTVKSVSERGSSREGTMSRKRSEALGADDGMTMHEAFKAYYSNMRKRTEGR